MEEGRGEDMGGDEKLKTIKKQLIFKGNLK